MSEFESRVGASPGAYRTELEMLADGKVTWVVFSGRMASGKDAVSDAIRLPGKSIKIGYGDALRAELARVMPLIHLLVSGESDWATIVQRVSTVLGIPEFAAAELLELLVPDLKDKPALTPYHRTENMRIALQRLGSTWHEADGPDFLPRMIAPMVMRRVRDGFNVVMAGSRFAPDADIPRLAGAITVRLDVSQETQIRRLASRDGLQPSPTTLAAMRHPGEVALDNYPHDLRLSNDTDGEEAFFSVVDAVSEFVTDTMRERQSRVVHPST